MIMWLTNLVSESVCVVIERIGNENVTDFDILPFDTTWLGFIGLNGWIFWPFGNLEHAMIVLCFDSRVCLFPCVVDLLLKKLYM